MGKPKSTNTQRDWRPVSGAVYDLRHTNLFVFNDRLYLLSYPGKLMYTTDGEKWIGVTNFFQIAPRDYNIQEIFVFKNSLHAFVSRLPESGTGPYSDDPKEIWKSDDGKNWHMLTTSLPFPSRLSGFSVTSYKDKIWLIGGYLHQDRPLVAYNDIWFTKGYEGMAAL